MTRIDAFILIRRADGPCRLCIWPMALRRETRGWRARFPPEQNEPWATSGGFCGDCRHTRSVQAASLLTSRIFSSQILAFACLFHTASPGTVGRPKWAKFLRRGAYMAHLVRTHRDRLWNGPRRCKPPHFPSIASGQQCKIYLG